MIIIMMIIMIIIIIIITESTPYDWLLDTKVLLAMLIWLIILTVFFLILCLVVVCKLKKTRNVHYKKSPYSFTNPAASSRSPSFNQWGTGSKGSDDMSYFAPNMGPGNSGGSTVGNSRDLSVQRSLSGTEGAGMRERPVKTKVVGNEKYTHM